MSTLIPLFSVNFHRASKKVDRITYQPFWRVCCEIQPKLCKRRPTLYPAELTAHILLKPNYYIIGIKVI